MIPSSVGMKDSAVPTELASSLMIYPTINRWAIGFRSCGANFLGYKTIKNARNEKEFAGIDAISASNEKNIAGKN